MIKGIADKPKDCPYSDRAWETYAIMTSCLNALNAKTGLVISKGDYHLADLLTRSQDIIWQLLDETGRLDEFFLEEKEEEEK